MPCDRDPVERGALPFCAGEADGVEGGVGGDGLGVDLQVNESGAKAGAGVLEGGARRLSARHPASGVSFSKRSPGATESESAPAENLAPG